MTNQNAPEQRWIKIDLHIHTPASEDYAERDVSYLQILREAEQRGLEMIAFTDHNTVAGYEQMRREVDFLQQLERTRRATAADHQQLDEYLQLLRAITVLPGFEFTSHYGAHILAIFPPTTSLTILEATLLQLGVPAERLKAGATGLPDTAHVTEAYETIAKAGGLVIAAHANGSNGVIAETLRMSTSGQARVAATQHQALSALEFVHFYTDHNTFTSPGFYNGKTEHYERRMFCLQGSDAHRVRRAPTGSDVAHRHGIGDRYFEALLPEPSFAALQHLLRSHEFERVRVPKRDQRQWDIDELRFGAATDRNILRDTTDLTVLLQDVAALANLGGGKLIIDPPGAGGGAAQQAVRPSELSEQLRVQAEQMLDPAPTLSFELVRYESREVVRVEVRAGQSPPYIMRGQTWMRRDAQTVPANRGEILQLARRALAEAGTSPLDNGQEWDLPCSGVEIVNAQRANGEWQYEIRDLRTMPNVVRERAQGLWSYALDRHSDLRDGRVDLEAQIRWVGQLGLWRMYQQGANVKYDLVHRDVNGIIDHVFYGVTDWGLGAAWRVLIDKVQRPDSDTLPPLEQEADDEPAELEPEPLGVTRGDLYVPAPNFGGRKARWHGRGALLRIQRSADGRPLFDLAMRDAHSDAIHEYLQTPADKLSERWRNLVRVERPRTGLEVVNRTVSEGIVQLNFRDLRSGEVSAPWRIEELKEGSLREYAARMSVVDQRLNEEAVRWWGNLGYLRPMRSQVDLVYRDIAGQDFFFYACRREELHGPWRQLLEAWGDTGLTASAESRPMGGARAEAGLPEPRRADLDRALLVNDEAQHDNDYHDAEH